MALRALKLGAPVGICVTASHNPASDNGVKLVEPTGEMLVPAWEAYADRLTGAVSADDLVTRVRLLVETERIPLGGARASAGSEGGEGRDNALVLVAFDTRPNSPGLADAAVAGAAALGVGSLDLGLLTTPQLHWSVAQMARGLPASEAAYVAQLTGAYAELLGGDGRSDATTSNEKEVVYVDCANGVGASKLAALAAALGPGTRPRFELVNVGGGELNGRCGADYVQKSRKLPEGVLPSGLPDATNAAYCALDGDADRIVFFIPEGPGLRLLDGDRIAALAAMLCSRVAADLSPALRPSIGLVQTAYANGASTRFLRDVLGLPVSVTKTGVKHLHAAAQAYDIGIYFEANGHGTVLFDPAYLQHVHQSSHTAPNNAQSARGRRAAAKLLALSRLVNQAVGDALSILLLVQVALGLLNKTLDDWAELYGDLPSRQRVCSVPDRSLLQTTDAERRVTAPARFQDAIDAAVAGVPDGAAVQDGNLEAAIQCFLQDQMPFLRRDSIVLLVLCATKKQTGAGKDASAKGCGSKRDRSNDSNVPLNVAPVQAVRLSVRLELRTW